MSREFKNVPYFNVKAASDGRTRTGICAVFGHIDDWGDRIQPGAFARTINNGRDRVKHLWNHDFSSLPTASIVDIREIGRDGLPGEVLAYAPDATGGLLVSRAYHDDEFSDMVLKRIDAGDITEMSFGYEVKQSDISTITDGENEIQVRELKELALFDTSDVLWGMNDATVAAFAKSRFKDRPLGAIIQDLELCAHNIKAGRRNNAQDEALITKMHQITLDLGYDKCMMADEQDEKSILKTNLEGLEPEPVTIADTSLLANELKLNDLRLSQFFRSENYVSISRETGGVPG